MREIEDLERDSQPFRGGLRLGKGLRLVRTSERHRDADDLVSLLLQEQRSDSGVDAARNSDCNFQSRAANYIKSVFAIIRVAMFSLFRRAFHPDTHTQRVLSGLCAAFVLAILAFSSVFVTVEADHDCDGHGCPICLEMQNCVANFQLLGSSTSSSESPLPPPNAFSPVETVPRTHHAPATTLQSLDVRFDE